MVVLGLAFAAKAQESAFLAFKQIAVLPHGVDALSVVDSGLYCHASGVFLAAKRHWADVYCLVPDTLLASLDDGVEYAVRQSHDGDLYFTSRDRNGVSRLYVAIRKGNKYKVKRVKMNNMEVEHPVFSEDGKIMVFASRERKDGLGGSDLWYSVFADGEWGTPENMGRRVNTRYDEVSPSMYGEFLVYASNGREQNHVNLDLYATRLLGEGFSGDTAGLFMIGTQRVQRLPEPINSPVADDRELFVDTVAGCGYWLSDREGGGLYSFSGTLDGMLLWGRVLDKMYKPVVGTTIEVRQDNRLVCTVKSDTSGLYFIYLRRDQMYTFRFYSPGCFAVNKNMNTVSFDRDNLFAEQRMDVELDYLPLDEPMRYDDIFEVGTSTELSSYGCSQLDPLVQFLRDNPDYKVSFSLACDVSLDRKFNEILTAHRLVALKGYMDIKLPATTKKSYINSCSEPIASGVSRLVVVVSKEAK